MSSHVLVCSFEVPPLILVSTRVLMPCRLMFWFTIAFLFVFSKKTTKLSIRQVIKCIRTNKQWCIGVSIHFSFWTLERLMSLFEFLVVENACSALATISGGYNGWTW